THFGDIMPASATTPGQGTRLKSIEQQFTQGGFETSARDLDLAISGTGFFVTRDALTGGTTYFSRNGSLSVDSQRYMVDSNGGYIQVLPVDAEGNITASGIAASRNLQLPLTSGTPRATSLVTMTANLPITADKPEDSAVPSGAASPLAVTLDFGTATKQAAGAFNISAIDQDGIASAKLSDVSIGEDGLVTGSFTDGTTQALGKLLIANFANPSGLRQRGDGRWTITGNSGDAIVGEAGSDAFGRIQSGALERANVDITEELVALIAAQRNFQANAKAIETANSMDQSIINLRS